MYRIIRVDGKVTDSILTYEKGAQIPPDDDAIAEITKLLNVNVKTISVEYTDVLPRVELTLPPSPPPPVTYTTDDRVNSIMSVLRVIAPDAVDKEDGPLKLEIRP